MTINSVQVLEGKAVEHNFTMSPVVSEGADSTTVRTESMTSTSGPSIPTTTTNSPNSTVVPSEENKSSPPILPPEPQPIQPQEFRHHTYVDMELFLRKYSSEFPSIVHLYSVGRSVDGHELYVMAISDNPAVHEHGRSKVHFSIADIMSILSIFHSDLFFCFHVR